MQARCAQRMKRFFKNVVRFGFVQKKKRKAFALYSCGKLQPITMMAGNRTELGARPRHAVVYRTDRAGGGEGVRFGEIKNDEMLKSKIVTSVERTHVVVVVAVVARTVRRRTGDGDDDCGGRSDRGETRRRVFREMHYTAGGETGKTNNFFPSRARVKFGLRTPRRRPTGTTVTTRPTGCVRGGGRAGERPTYHGDATGQTEGADVAWNNRSAFSPTPNRVRVPAPRRADDLAPLPGRRLPRHRRHSPPSRPGSPALRPPAQPYARGAFGSDRSETSGPPAPAVTGGTSMRRRRRQSRTAHAAARQQ